MKRVVIFLLIILGINQCFAGEDLSQLARAFYSDNNFDRTLDTLLQIDEQERTASDWLLLGNLMDEKGETSNAVFMYQKAVKTDPKYYKTYYNLGNIYLSKEQYTLAVENYKNALKYTKTNPYLYYNLSCAYLKQGKVNDAKNALIKAVTIKNDIPEIHYNLAYIYKSLNKPELAKTYLANYNKLTSEY